MTRVTAETITVSMIEQIAQSDYRWESYRGIPIHVIAYRARWSRTERGKLANLRKCVEIWNARHAKEST